MHFNKLNIFIFSAHQKKMRRILNISDCSNHTWYFSINRRLKNVLTWCHVSRVIQWNTLNKRAFDNPCKWFLTGLRDQILAHIAWKKNEQQRLKKAQNIGYVWIKFSSCFRWHLRSILLMMFKNYSRFNGQLKYILLMGLHLNIHIGWSYFFVFYSNMLHAALPIHFLFASHLISPTVW